MSSHEGKNSEHEQIFLSTLSIISRCNAHISRIFYKNLGYEVLLNYTQLDPARKIVPPQNDADIELFPESDKVNLEKLRLLAVLLPPSQLAEIFPNQSDTILSTVQDETCLLVDKYYLLKRLYQGYLDKCHSLIMSKSDLIAKQAGEKTDSFFLNGFKERIIRVTKDDSELQDINLILQSLDRLFIMLQFTLLDSQKLIEKMKKDGGEDV